jgi:tight adherence protein B
MTRSVRLAPAGLASSWSRSWRRSARRLRRLEGASQPPSLPWPPALRSLATRHRPPVACASAALAGGLAWAVAGPVGAGLAAGYACAAVLALARRWRVRAEAEAMQAALDAVTGLAADLRAGLSPAAALGHALPAIASSSAPDVRRVASAVAAAWRVADAAGVRLADLLERLADDVTGLRRVRSVAAAQAAGAQATAMLLAGLPVAGLALGYAMGADPVHVLLRTPLGALCAGLAGALQMAGLAWSARLARSIAEVS